MHFHALISMVEETTQAVHTIKQLLERMVLPPAQPTLRLRSAVEGTWVKQQVTKTTTRGNATSNRRANSHQISWSQAEFTRSMITDKRRRNEAGPSRPQNRTASGRTVRPGVTSRLHERGVTEYPPRPSSNVFDQLGRSRGEDMRTHLEARRTVATSRKKQEEAVVSPVNDEINELRA